MRLDKLPDEVRESAHKIAELEHEKLIGWKAITGPRLGVPDSRIDYMVITDKGYYEVNTDGTCYRAAVLHPF